MNLDLKIISEIERYKSINKYILEQTEALPPAEPPLAPGGGEPEPATGAAPATQPPADATKAPEPIDVESDPEVEKIDSKGKSEEEDSETEELEITDLVDSQKTIETKQEEYFQNLFNQISTLESKLAEMDSIMSKLNSLENKIEKYREKTPQEKLELRTYDSYPFNQKLSDFFEDKKNEMEKTGKHDYVLTADQVTDINTNDIKNSFQPGNTTTNDYEFRK